MFTGIVEELGTLRRRDDLSGAARLTVGASTVVTDVRAGDSIAVNGVCLTVTDADTSGFSADVMQETLDHSSLGKLAAGDPVNLERAVTAHTRLGGHLVQGHVDETATVLTRNPDEHWDVVRFSLPVQLARYVVHKGSITVDGVSLTVSAVGPDWFEVSLIPTTLERTTLGSRRPGDTVNLEVDVIAKYVEKLLTDGGRA
ncbi:MAG: riboflavin synthase [Geodermatophilaceae bacterium]|nr:riboflavin synthase [Geodermatophilaceae bacterium]